MKRFFFQTLLLLALPAAVFAQSAPIKKIMETARDDNRAMQHLDILCNRFGGRPVGSATTRWASTARDGGAA